MFKIKNAALIVIDVQGRLAQLMPNKKRLFKQIEIMIEASKLLEIPIFWMEQYPQGLGATITEIKSLLEAQKPYEKISFSSCGQEQFVNDIKASGRNELIITGIETHVCVYQTALDLLAEGFLVSVNQDAVSSRRKSNKLLGLHNMEKAGASITSTEMILFELMRTAQNPKLRQISSLLK
ncbi:MAG: hydrolase [Marinicella sp.]